MFASPTNNDSLAPAYSEKKSHEVRHKGSINIDKRNVNDGDELREEDDVDKVRAEGEQTVHGLDDQTESQCQGAIDANSDTDHPNQLSLRGLSWIGSMEISFSDDFTVNFICIALQ